MKLKPEQWKNLVENKEEEIREALEKIFRNAITDSIGAFKVSHTAILDDDGEIRFQHDTGNTTDGHVWNGKAIYLGFIQDFTPWEDDDEWKWIKNSLTEEEKEKFIQFCNEKYGEEEYNRDFRSLEEFDEKIYNRIVKDCIIDYIDIEMENWIDKKYYLLLQEIQERTNYEGE